MSEIVLVVAKSSTEIWLCFNWIRQSSPKMDKISFNWLGILSSNHNSLFFLKSPYWLGIIAKLSNNLESVYFGGRLAEYKYYDMHQVIEKALNFISMI